MNTDDLPEEIEQLIGRCEINETRFDNDDMSVALKFGELLWHRLSRMAEHYELRAEHMDAIDPRRKVTDDAAKGMRHVLADCKKDL